MCYSKLNDLILIYICIDCISSRECHEQMLELDRLAIVTSYLACNPLSQCLNICISYCQIKVYFTSINLSFYPYICISIYQINYISPSRLCLKIYWHTIWNCKCAVTILSQAGFYNAIHFQGKHWAHHSVPQPGFKAALRLILIQ